MKATLIKPWADLRRSWRQVVLAVAALVVGLWGIGSILVSYSVLTRDLRQNFLATQPAHAIVVSPDFARLDLEGLRQRSGVEAADLRDLSMQRIEVAPGEWIPLWLFGVRDFGQTAVARLQVQSGAAVPAPGAMLVERDGLNISNLRQGTAARVRAAGRVLDIPVAGITFDAAQAPATQDHFIYAYVDKATYAQISGQPVDERLLLRLKNVRDASDVRHQLQPLLAEFAAQGLRVQSVQVPAFEEHPHQWQLDTLLLMQGAIGLLAFLMGAVLVAQLMASLLARQVREIGIMKSMGATSRQILLLYAGMVLAMSALAGALATPLAISTGNAFSHFVAGKLNFDILTTRLPLPVLLALGAACLLLPLATSLPVLLRGTNRPVLDALTDGATRTSHPRRRRAAVTMLTLALGVAIFDTGFNLRQSLASLLAEMDRSMGHDVQIVLKSPASPQAVLPLFEGLPNLQRVEVWNGGRGELQSHAVATSEGVGIVALPWDTALFHPKLVTGRWLLDGDRAEVVMNRGAASLYHHPSPGDRVRVEVGGVGIEATLVGIVDELEKPKIYIDRARYDAAFNPSRRMNSLMLVADDPRYDRVMALKREVERVIEQTDLDVLYVMSQAERVRVIADHLDIVLSVVVALSLLVLVVGAMGMGSAMAIDIRDRAREIGVMRAIGATPGMVMRRILGEGLALSSLSIVLGFAMAWPLGVAASAAFGRLMLGEGGQLNFEFSPVGLGVALLAALLFALIASYVPARWAVRVSPREALAQT